ncbi:zinc finger CCCH-type with G patch domain-containing protein-like [Clytia hemisphaerica]|uniref:zinc finger CCCH-type with G patch domain-containing protein-like n=1 Tax=Clytia hemisphaerica TaxID=252671 RepID=UPI0034D5A281
MGYIFGKGLGKDSEGRIEPVEIRLLPPGKSLDKIAELREKGYIKDPTKRKNQSVKKQIAAEIRTKNKEEKERATFDLIDGLTNRKGKTGTAKNIFSPILNLIILGVWDDGNILCHEFGIGNILCHEFGIFGFAT